jgi:hypothetical protein
VSDAERETETEHRTEAEHGTETEPTAEADSTTGAGAEAVERPPEGAEKSTEAADINEETELLDGERDEAAAAARREVARTPTPVGESTLIARTVVRVVTPLILLTAVAL